MARRHGPQFLSRQQLCRAICQQVHISRRNPRSDDSSMRELTNILNYVVVLQQRVADGPDRADRSVRRATKA
jgi:hypothetical protein